MDIPQIVAKSEARTGDMGQKYLVTGKDVALRSWEEAVGEMSEAGARNYETVGFLLSGKLQFELGSEVAELKPGDSWLVPAGAPHRYKVLEDITAIEATSPPARFSGRDEAPEVSKQS
jgi:quercetin dioxygenase-like cupin family protein